MCSCISYVDDDLFICTRAVSACENIAGLQAPGGTANELEGNSRYALTAEFGFFIIFVYCVFVYFTNYFRVCIFVYLVTINFILVLIEYFQNIVYSCITIDFTVSYVKIAHIYYIPCTCNYSKLYTFVTLYEFACTCAVYSTFLKCESWAGGV